MKQFLTLLSLILFISCAPESKQSEKVTYEENWKSLQNYKIPEWFKDAKLGIFIHWGPASVTDYGGWYARNLYMPDSCFSWSKQAMVPGTSPTYKWHKEKFGDPKEFGYKDLIPLFTAEKFDAKEWVNLFKKSGAKYVVPVAEHHDGYAMYNSSYTRWNSVEMGPRRDILKELLDETRAQGLYTGASSHFAFHWNFYRFLDGYDTTDPQYEDLYGKPHKWSDNPSQEHLNMWWNRTKEIIDNYKPDILWFDFFIDKPAFVPFHAKLASYYYNKGLENEKEFVLQTKNYGFESYPAGTHLLDLERGLMDRIRKPFWQTDTSLGSNAWFYKSNWKSRTANSLIDDFIDMVSKNGSLLLNVGPRADGTIPEEQKAVLLEMGEWLGVCGEAIYGTRPWTVFGEGPTKVKAGHKTELKANDYTGKDIRFTQKGNSVYALLLDWPKNNEAIISSLSTNLSLINYSPEKVELLGYDEELDFERSEKGLIVKMPTKKTNKHAFALKLTFPEGSSALLTPEEEAGTL